ncbi:LytR/AlgR family response regulator transcription factor [Sporosarcina aquimarina]|uniref:LytTR family DNA-binding domain-containing protein n=1 Tax=Sporosarcina aquimarina TaxID=114975 RepID=A0ABU4FZC7_9BACL|nr:LytTR family DNA-binding domain-containing protein [Sporosarcina aquimarina]MDW0110067.1 LytTR family DNA-binding domain-containing protein [Sporosarcina aquimarina]
MPSNIRALVVDDERYAREELIFLLSRHPNVEIVGEADSGDTAIMQAIRLQPDVVFLDVEMPKMNGIEVAAVLKELKTPPQIVFATAYPQFAADAFRVNAIDYLLKPYEEDQLTQTLHRIKVKETVETANDSLHQLGKLAMEKDGEIVYIPINSILYVCREGSVTRITTKKEVYEVKLTLKELEKRLLPFSFYRIHKSYLVNLLHVSRLSPWFNGAYQLEIEGIPEKLSVSRNYVKGLRATLEH